MQSVSDLGRNVVQDFCMFPGTGFCTCTKYLLHAAGVEYYCQIRFPTALSLPDALSLTRSTCRLD